MVLQQAGIAETWLEVTVMLLPGEAKAELADVVPVTGGAAEHQLLL